MIWARYGISVPTVWIAARRAGHSGAHNDINTAAVGEESNASATGTTRSSVGAIGLCRDVDDDVDDEEGTTMRSSTSRAEVRMMIIIIMSIDDACVCLRPIVTEYSTNIL